jgi:hypothetical protein
LIATISEPDRDRVIATITLAFALDPVVRWIYQDSLDYLSHWPRFVERVAGERSPVAQDTLQRTSRASPFGCLQEPHPTRMASSGRCIPMLGKREVPISMRRSKRWTHTIRPALTTTSRLPVWILRCRVEASDQDSCVPAWTGATKSNSPPTWKQQVPAAEICMPGTVSLGSASSRTARCHPRGRCCDCRADARDYRRRSGPRQPAVESRTWIISRSIDAAPSRARGGPSLGATPLARHRISR